MLVALSIGLFQATAVIPAAHVAAAPPERRAAAVRADQSPLVDGRDDDAIWRVAVPITDFYEFEPIEGKVPRYRTEARIAYDSRNLYIFVRMFDPEPDKLLRLLSRRDVRGPTDQVKVIVDSYHDRRSGFQFAVNPAGVKLDFSLYNDSNEDVAWDGVWDVGTTVDSLGWTAEFRIPLSQLRYGAADSHTFGVGIWRDIERHKERVSWPSFQRNQAGIASQLGEVTGFEGLPSPRRAEISPYLLTKNETVFEGTGARHPQRLAGGVDLKFGVSSNLTLDATVNPDFGQVEADPAQLNLTAFETFFGERRPFFIEGGSLLSMRVNCYVVRDCGNEMLFYSRRIGRAPSLSDRYGDATSPTGTTILGAAKLTGRTPSGWSVGLLEAVTGREVGTGDRTIEPRTSYTVARLTKDFRRGASGIGVIGTMVQRANDGWTEDALRSSAVVGGVDFRHRFARNQFELSGQLIGSRVAGDPASIAATQTSSVHYFQRPDAELSFDPTRTSLSGTAQQLRLAKVGGGKVRFETSYQRVSPGFEINDLGFLRRADWQAQATWMQLAFNQPGPFFRQLFWNFNQASEWNTEGLLLERSFNTNVHFSFPNNWWLHGGVTSSGLGEAYCDRCARGGPAVRTDNFQSAWGGIEGDSRMVIIPSLWFSTGGRDGGRSRSYSIDPSMRFRVSSRWSSSLGLGFGWNEDDRQWYDNVVDAGGATHYTFGRLTQRTASVVGRVDYTASPDLTVQLYLQPFISKGRFSNIRELADPRAADYDDRYRPYAGAGDPAEFNVKQFRSNAVVRWEYRPGSAIFLVWQHGRFDRETRYGERSFSGDLGALFRTPATNTFLLKMSYWINR